jgi:hypothetical protein
MPTARYDEMVADISNILRGIGYVYQDRRDVNIVVSVDGIDHMIDYSDAIGWSDVEPEQSTTIPLEIWCKDGEMNRVYHSEDGEMVRFNRDAVNPAGRSRDVVQAKRIRDYNSATDSGYSKQGEFALRIVYNPSWNAQRLDFIRGHLSFRRNRRHLARFDTDVPSAGDYERRRVLGATRCSLDYTYTSDKFVRAEGNKSNVTKANVDQSLLRTVRDLARKWADAYYKRFIAPARVENVVEIENSVPRDTVAQFKLNYANPAWRAAYIEFVRAHLVT